MSMSMNWEGWPTDGSGAHCAGDVKVIPMARRARFQVVYTSGGVFASSGLVEPGDVKDAIRGVLLDAGIAHEAKGLDLMRQSSAPEAA